MNLGDRWSRARQVSAPYRRFQRCVLAVVCLGFLLYAGYIFIQFQSLPRGQAAAAAGTQASRIAAPAPPSADVAQADGASAHASDRSEPENKVADTGTGGATGWLPYQSGWFGFSFKYPADRLAPIHTNEEGRPVSFNVLRGSGTASVSGSYETGADPVAERIHTDQEDCIGGKAPYTVLKRTRGIRLGATSCSDGKGRILYTKALQCRDVLTVLNLSYPESEKADWDPVVKGMSASLNAGCGMENGGAS